MSLLQNFLSYDYHPIVVHIPVAFLMIFSIFEIITIIFFSKFKDKFFWTKVFLLIVGLLGAQAALSTGEMASHINNGEVSREILRAHENWASLASGIFFGILIAYLFILIYKETKLEEKLSKLINRSDFTKKVFSIKKKIGEFFYKNSWIFVLASIAGFIAVSVTGALGGAMVYGKDADPFITMTLKILGLY